MYPRYPLGNGCGSLGIRTANFGNSWSTAWNDFKIHSLSLARGKTVSVIRTQCLLEEHSVC